MTLPASPVNNQGGFYTSNIPVNTAVLVAPGAAVNVAATVPSAPTYNFANTITSTREALNGIGENVPQQGSNVTSGTVSFNTLSAAQFQTFKWQ